MISHIKFIISHLTIYPWGSTWGRRLLLVLLLFWGAGSVALYGQEAREWSVEELQRAAEGNYPLVKQYNLIEQSRDFTVSNASKGYLPQLSMSGKVSFQSDVTQLPTAMPGITPMNKDQYQALLEVNQTIWDGGAIESQKRVARATAESEMKRNDADLYVIRERVNQLFFGILLYEEQIKQTSILTDELNNNLRKISAFVENGIATKSDLDAVKVEILKAAQRMEELRMSERTYREVLAALTGTPGVKSDGLKRPSAELTSSENRRPELEYFNSQLNLITNQESSIRAASMPRLNLFLQGGYGNPGLNMLKNEFSTYYIGGVRLAWNIGSLYTRGNSLKKLETGKESIRVQRETFLFNNSLAEMQQINEVTKLVKQLKADDEIIALRESIKRAAEERVQEGTLSVSDLIREINAHNLARQERATHEIMHMMAIYSIKYLKNH